MICKACNNACQAYARDEGIGSHDYGGVRMFHSVVVAYSECCDAQVVDEDGELVRCEDVFDDFDEPEEDADWYYY